jgi:beta-lactamase class A
MQVLLKLAKGEVVSPEDSDEMRRILSDQQLNEMIPAGLPFDTHVAHKTGSAADYFHDAGIIYPARGETFVLAILTKGYPESDEDAAHAFVASLARAVYDYWNQEKSGELDLHPRDACAGSS